MKLEDIDHTELIAKGIACLRFKKSNDYTADLKQIPLSADPTSSPIIYETSFSYYTLAIV